MLDLQGFSIMVCVSLGPSAAPRGEPCLTTMKYVTGHELLGSGLLPQSDNGRRALNGQLQALKRHQGVLERIRG